MTGLKKKMEMSTCVLGPLTALGKFRELPKGSLQVASADDPMEESKDQVEQPLSPSLKELLEDNMFQYFPEFGCVAYSDAFVTIYQVKALSSNPGDTPIYSYIGIPKLQAAKLNVNEVIRLGCNPRLHSKPLKEGKCVTLADGKVITPDQVLSKQEPSEAFLIVFLPDESYIDSFIADNQTLFRMV